MYHALMRYNPQEQLTGARSRNDAARRQLLQSMQNILKDKKSQLTSGVRHLDALSPLKVMARGYSLVYDEQEKRLIKSIHEVQPGDVVQIKVNDGQLSCQVWELKEDAQEHGE